MFGQRPMPQLLLQPVDSMGDDVLASGIDELSYAFKNAAWKIVYNTERLRRQARAGDLHVGDHLIVYASDASKLEPQGNHGYIVTWVRGPVVSFNTWSTE